MPSWNSILEEINTAVSPIDDVRRKYLRELGEYTGRNVIAYYSGWLQLNPNLNGMSICDDDKNGFMNAIHGMDRTKGLDLILHTPGGEIAATESIVHYLRSIFGTDIRTIIPQIAMSAGTMIACSSKEILMGRQSNLGPIDPQFGGVATQAVIDEFNRAIEDATANPNSIPIWQAIISKYHPTFIGECERAIAWSEEMVTSWLVSGMFEHDQQREQKAKDIVAKLSDHDKTRTHSRHIHIDDCLSMGLKVSQLEDDQELQDKVLSVHHAFIITVSKCNIVKAIENNAGIGFFRPATT